MNTNEFSFHAGKFAHRGTSLKTGAFRYRLLALIGILVLLTAAGCTSSYQVDIEVLSETEWAASVNLSFVPAVAEAMGGDAALKKAMESDLNSTLFSQGVQFDLKNVASPGVQNPYTYNFAFKGHSGFDQAREAFLGNDDYIAGLLEGPVSLSMSGQVNRGEILVVILESNPATGYSWEMIRSEDRNALLERAGNVEYFSDTFGLGAAAKQKFTFVAKSDGQATLQFIYMRPWLEAKSPERVISIQAPELRMISNLGDSRVFAIPETVESEDASFLQILAGEQVLDAPVTNLALPASFDWRKKGKVTSVKDQGGCGSCWAFSTVGPFESLLKIKQKVTTDLSEQYLVSCNTDGWGCNGGWFAHDYHWKKKPPSEKRAGAVLEKAFPYAEEDVSCGGPYKHPYKLTGWRYVTNNKSVPSVAKIKEAIYRHGPVSVAVCAGSAFQSYKSGVFKTNETCSGVVNHGVVLVGWDDAKKAWILRNSWGTSWGQKGYMYIRYGTSKVGYAANYVTYAAPSYTIQDFYSFAWALP